MQKLGIYRYCFLICNLVLWFGVHEVKGQHYLLSNKPQLNQKKSLYHLPIGENQFGTYTMNYVSMYLKDGFSLEWYDNELGIQDDRFIDVAKRTWVLRIWNTDSTVCWLSATKKRRQGYLLYLNQISFDLKGDIQSKLLGNLPVKEINTDDIIVRNHLVDFSILIGFVKKAKAGSSTINMVRYSSTGDLLESLSKDVAYEMNSLYWEDMEMSTYDGSRYLGVLHLTKSKDVFSRNTRQSVYISIGKVGSKSDSLSYFETKNEEFLQRPSLMYNPTKMCWVIAGLWGDIKTESKGYWVWEIFNETNEKMSDLGRANNYVGSDVSQLENPQKHEDFTLKEYSFSAARTLDGVIKRKKQIHPENYITRRLIPQADGSVIMLLERFLELRQLETYYINGIPQTATKILYNYNEIGVLFLNQGLEIDTCLRVEKEQTSSPNTAYLLGFGSYVCQDGIHLLFNADITKNNDVMDVVIRPDFEIKSQVLLNSDHVYSVLVPMDGKETNYCAFTVPLLKDKQWFWMKVVDYDK
jgi:hypothetical protein